MLSIQHLKSVVLMLILIGLIASGLFIYTVIIRYNGEVIMVLPELNANANYYSGLITIVVSLFALGLPLSVNAITANQDQRFSNNEMGVSFYNNKEYRLIKRSVFVLIMLLIASYFENTSFYIDFLVSCLTIFLLVRFLKFLSVVERYVSDFPGLLISEEKDRINDILQR